MINSRNLIYTNILDLTPGRHPGHNCVSGDVFSHHRTRGHHHVITNRHPRKRDSPRR